jgi:DNA-binding HxlR family transcriptional regulator/putative sterol carrier protein
MGKKRSYADACGIGRALDVVGERWAIHVVRELLLGPKRFTDVRAALPQLSSDVLAQRLRELEAAGLVSHRRLPPPAASKVYELTDRGRELEPVLLELGRWGARLPLPEGLCMSVDSLVVSLRTLFDPELAGDFAARLELRLGEERFRVEIAAGEIAAERGELADPDAVLETDPGTFVDLLHGVRKLSEAVGSGNAAIEGDRRALTRFLRLFPLPEPAPVP